MKFSRVDIQNPKWTTSETGGTSGIVVSELVALSTERRVVNHINMLETKINTKRNNREYRFG
jgi:hypothetical protein